jgi:hypothetical protein
MTAMTCERLKAILPDYFEGDLTGEAKAAADAHLQNCASCSAIVADIERITREAAALPAMRPARDLWSGIEERITASVIPLAKPAHRNVRRFPPAWMAAAAAALIVTTAGITYLATTRINEASPRQVASAAPINAKPVTATVDSSAAGAVRSPSAVETGEPKASETEKTAPRPSAPRMSGGSAALASNAGSARTAVTAANATALGTIQAEAQYAHEISTLERMMNAPNSGLDSATVQIVKRNLQLIDDAIAQSKAALAKDPASPLLYDQVTRAMGKKVELLRTMVSLSSST